MTIRLGVTVLLFFFFPLDESKQCQSDVQKIASEKAKLGEKVGKYNRLAEANDCVEMKEVLNGNFPWKA